MEYNDDKVGSHVAREPSTGKDIAEGYGIMG